MGIGAVVLAAGGSLRFGSPKQLLDHHGENLVRRAARVAIESGFDPVLVVLGAYAPIVESFLAGLDVRVHVNEDWQSGQASSLLVGIEAATRAECDAVAVLLADQPLVDTDSLRALADAFGPEHRVVASRYNGIIGAPAVFGCEYFPELEEMTGDHGAGRWLRSRADIVTTIDLPEAAFDIDTPDDLRQVPQ